MSIDNIVKIIFTNIWKIIAIRIFVKKDNAMKRKITILMLCMPVLASAQSNVITDGIRYCESTCPYGNGVLVANFGTEQLNPLNSEGKGYILYCHDGISEMFVPADGNLSAPKGMYSRDGYLYVCDVNRIVVYDLADVETAPAVVYMPEGSMFVNDLAADGDDLYVSVTDADMVYKLDISDPFRPGTPVPWLSVKGPNGLLLHEGEMFVASYPADGNTTPENVLYRVRDLERPVAERFIDRPGQYDGLAVSSDGRYLYVSEWEPAQVSRIDLNDGSVAAVETGLEQPLSGPADISVSGGKIYIPDLPGSRVAVTDELR